MNLECGSCRYKFEREIIPNKCPYCNHVGAVGVSKTAQDILDEAVSDGAMIDREKQERENSLK